VLLRPLRETFYKRCPRRIKSGESEALAELSIIGYKEIGFDRYPGNWRRKGSFSRKI